MYPFPLSTRPVRRYLQERPELLHNALGSLARRLRESLAVVLGTHLGDAVRDAVQAALDQRTPAAPPYDDPDDFPRRDRHEDWRDPSGEYDAPRSRAFEAPPGLWQSPLPKPTPPVPPSSSRNGPRRCWPLLPAALQALSGWWCWQENRRPVLALLGIGTLAGALTLMGSPSASALLAAVSTVFTLTGLIDGIRATVGRGAGAATP
jgi:hypothetical protein